MLCWWYLLVVSVSNVALLSCLGTCPTHCTLCYHTYSVGYDSVVQVRRCVGLVYAVCWHSTSAVWCMSVRYVTSTLLAHIAILPAHVCLTEALSIL